jgi:hypothetical protein
MEACAIGVLHGDTITGICSNTLGGLEYTGLLLYQYFDSVKINTLVKYGNVELLGAEIGSTHDADSEESKLTFEDDQIKMTVNYYTTFYMRDLKQPDNESEQFLNRDKYVEFYRKYKNAKHFYLRVKTEWMKYDSNIRDWVYLEDLLMEPVPVCN